MRERFERFDKYMQSKGLNDNQVTIQCDLSQGLLGQARTGKSDLGKKTIDKILNVYQDLNRVWLLTGEGEMLNETVPEDGSPAPEAVNNSEINPMQRHPAHDDDEYVPLLPVEAMAGTLQMFAEGVELAMCRKIKSPVKGADWAIQISGDSMEPDYKNGSYLFIKRMSGTFIPWGHTMVVDTYDGVVVKDIYPSDDDPDSIEARSINPKYPPFSIHMSIIIGIYRVLGGSFINSTI